MYLASEIIKKKGRHLFITPTDKQTCFSVNLALLADPDLTMSEAISVGRSIHIRSGLSVDVKVAFNDNVRFEELLGCEIVVFYSAMGKGNQKTWSNFKHFKRLCGGRSVTVRHSSGE